MVTWQNMTQPRQTLKRTPGGSLNVQFLPQLHDRLLENDRKLADALVGTFSMLPPDCQHEVLRRLAVAVALHDRTGDLDPVRHFSESLVMTVRAQRCAAYQRVTAEPESPGEPRDIDDVIAEIEARHRDQGT
jgi:hypothetical protein